MSTEVILNEVFLNEHKYNEYECVKYKNLLYMIKNENRKPRKTYTDTATVTDVKIPTLSARYKKSNDMLLCRQWPESLKYYRNHMQVPKFYTYASKHPIVAYDTPTKVHNTSFWQTCYKMSVFLYCWKKIRRCINAFILRRRSFGKRSLQREIESEILSLKRKIDFLSKFQK